MNNSVIESLEQLVDGALPDDLSELDEDQLALIKEVVDQVLEKERAGFDRFFESISQTLKYLPNFLVLAITNKYIDPPIAARITAKLPMKNALSIAKGLSSEYICQTARFLDEAYAAELLSLLPKKLAIDVLDGLYKDYPLTALDIIEKNDNRLKGLVKPPESFWAINVESLSEHRKRAFDSLKDL